MSSTAPVASSMACTVSLRAFVVPVQGVERHLVGLAVGQVHVDAEAARRRTSRRPAGRSTRPPPSAARGGRWWSRPRCSCCCRSPPRSHTTAATGCCCWGPGRGRTRRPVNPLPRPLRRHVRLHERRRRAGRRRRRRGRSDRWRRTRTRSRCRNRVFEYFIGSDVIPEAARTRDALDIIGWRDTWKCQCRWQGCSSSGGSRCPPR